MADDEQSTCIIVCWGGDCSNKCRCDWSMKLVGCVTMTRASSFVCHFHIYLDMHQGEEANRVMVVPIS